MLVACSGGPDSQALLSVLHALHDERGFALTAVGVDHGLRPAAPAELALAERLATELGLPFVRLTVQVAQGASRQAAARRARYDALLQCAIERGASAVAVGHTRDDQAETVLARLLRGASIEGLGAIAPRRADGVVRPLIDCPRAWVHAYVAEHGIPFANDPSNADPRYLRVRVRSALLPALQQENPRLSEQLAALADDAREAGELLHERAADALARAAGVLTRLRDELPVVRRAALKLSAERAGAASLTRAHVLALERMLWVRGEVRLPGDLLAVLDDADGLALTAATKRGRGTRRQPPTGS